MQRHQGIPAVPTFEVEELPKSSSGQSGVQFLENDQSVRDRRRVSMFAQPALWAQMTE